MEQNYVEIQITNNFIYVQNILIDKNFPYKRMGFRNRQRKFENLRNMLNRYEFFIN